MTKVSTKMTRKNFYQNNGEMLPYKANTNNLHLFFNNLQWQWQKYITNPTSTERSTSKMQIYTSNK